MSAPPERAVVLSGTGGVWQVLADGGHTREVSLRGRLKKADTGRRADGSIIRDTVRAAADVVKLAVGDEVLLEPDDRGESWAIGEILPRRSRLARREPGGRRGERVIAANVDQVVIVFAAAKPDPHTRMLDRFLVIAEANELAARVVINKADLVPPAEIRARFADYERAGYPLHPTSVKAAIGIDELRAALAGRTSALTGPSGVGKSSLLNTIYPGLNLRVGEISESVNKGRHTTVGALLHPLPAALGGGFVVDTPGLREVGMWGLEPEALDRCFPEIRALVGECRFADCTHRMEPGCALKAAVADGSVSAARFDSYLKLRAELEGESPQW
ncbi:MAG: Ribosome small subunit biogenesis RbfA-release protein RsgA [uncultured Gemmatimonadaceae bacterium]|uniref:Small ribosomal subunit biogenesis GTPase RsgA n=1 Tax=uncultured Gemmatimonadaceae bacterium TaxID=246130 RepID=A0A6J4KMJ0_9BACT|nr:MAG: Ribosome small subunit biogenesis RbfA-release protein RsgA [uncultured Gemmatimonadaceae bacterium]